MTLQGIVWSILLIPYMVCACEQPTSVVDITRISKEPHNGEEQTRCQHGAAAPTLTSVCCVPKDVVFDTIVTNSIIVEQLCVDTQQSNNLNVNFTTSSTYYDNLNRGEQINGEREIFPAYGNRFDLTPLVNPLASAQFGSAVALDRDGTIAVVGAQGSGILTGRLYIFMQFFDTWQLVANLTGSDTGPNDFFGCSVAISGDGTVIVVGASQPLGVGNGKAYIFVRTGPTTWTEQQILTGPGSVNGSVVGFSVAMSYDGRVIAVGSPAPSNKVYIFRRNTQACDTSLPTWNLDQILSDQQQPGESFGFSVSLNGDGSVLAVGAPFFNQGIITAVGTVFIYTHSDTTGWSLLKQIDPDPTQPGFDSPNANFGVSVALNGDATGLVIGSTGWIVNGQATGVVLYIDKPLIFSAQRYVYNPGNILGGRSVSISHDGRIFLAPSLVQPINTGGEISVWLSTSNVPVTNLAFDTLNTFFSSQIVRSGGGAQFGFPLALSCDGGYFIVADQVINTGAGAAYIYRTAGGVIPINLCVSRDLHIGRNMYLINDFNTTGNIRVNTTRSVFANINAAASVINPVCVDETTT